MIEEIMALADIKHKTLLLSDIAKKTQTNTLK
jgi:hypothetical protein